jgi:hypothetical protein
VLLKEKNGGVECRIISDKYNVSFRTRNGESETKYKTLQSLQNALIVAVKKHLKYDGDLTFSMSDEIHIK